MAILSCAVQDPTERETVFSEINNPTANPADNVSISVGPTAVGPWSPAQVVDLNCNPAPNTGNLFAFPGSGQYITGLVPGSTNFIKWSILPGSPDPAEDLVCGPYVAPDFPTFTCVPNQIGSNDVQILEGGTTGLTDLGFCHQDTYTLEYGTVAGGPYPLSVSAPFASLSALIQLTGLSPETVYYTKFHAFDDNNVEFFTGNECSFETRGLSCGRIIGLNDTWEEVPNHNGNNPGVIKVYYPPGTGPTQ